MIKKQYIKSRNIYKTTFQLPKELAVDANKAELLGDFNAWGKEEKIEMQQLKNGNFKAVVELSEGQYQFKYVLDGNRWENDNEADSYTPDPYNGQNSVVIVQD